MAEVEISHSKPGKASFEHIYNQADPRPYFNTLEKLGYETPAHGQALFPRLLEAQENDRGSTIMLDLCCSYGVNAALLNHDLSLDDLYSHYRSEETESMTTDELVAHDRHFFRQRRRPDPVEVVGVDVADRAVEYGARTGLLEAASSVDLESQEPGDELEPLLGEVGMVTVTGGVGYIGAPTFRHLLEHCTDEEPPWVAAFALRWVDYEPIAESLAEFGLQTERLDAYFPQRRFKDEAERTYALDQLEDVGVDSTRERRDGRYYAYFYLSRPAHDAHPPASELLNRQL